VSAAPKCGRCRHTEHRGECKRRGPSRCTPLDSGHGLTGFACGARPQCPCPWRVCVCGTPVAIATCEDDPEFFESVERGTAGRLGGTLAVRQLADGTLMARYLPPGEQPREGEWRGTDHDAACPKAAQRGVTEITGMSA
jgi:hypothetical protein